MGGLLGSLGWSAPAPPQAPQASLENPGTPFGQAVLDAFGDGSGSMTSAGTVVTADTKNLDVLTCIRIISETVASLPFHVMEAGPDGKTRRVYDHPVRRLFAGQASLTMSGFSLREAIISDLLGWGNGYAIRVTDDAGKLGALRYVPASNVYVEADRDYGRVYHLRDGRLGDEPSRIVTFVPGEMFHVTWRTRDGIRGISPITAASGAVGLAEAQALFASLFFGQGSHMSGIITHPGKLGDTAVDRVRKGVERLHAGVARSHRIAVLDEGMTFAATPVNLADLQLVDQQQYSTARIAAFYRLTPDRLNIFQKAATYASLDATEVRHAKDAILPVCTRFEAEVDRQLLYRWGVWDLGSTLPASPKVETWCKFNLDAVLRGDPDTRANVQSKYRQIGVLNADEIRAMEDLDELADGLGSTYLVPENLRPANLAYPESRGREAGSLAPEPAATKAPPAKAVAAKAVGVALASAVTAQREFESRALQRAIKDNPKADAALRVVLEGLDVPKIAASLRPVVEGFAGALGRTDASAIDTHAGVMAFAYVARARQLAARGEHDSEASAVDHLNRILMAFVPEDV